MRILGTSLLVLLTLGGAMSEVGAQPRAGSASRGAAAFGQCRACHSVAPGMQLTGPSLAHVWGQRAGTVEGFTRYSESFRRTSIVWDERSLDRWIADPRAFVPGNLMTFAGVKDAQQRADLVAYLKAVAAGQAPPPPAGGGMMGGGGMMAGGAHPDLKALGSERRVKTIRHCGDGYHVTTEDGRTVPFWEFNLRFKTDSSQLGPSPGRPVLIPAGMQGDRVSVVFSSPAEISRFIEQRC
jgi:cytochrome c